MMYLNYQHNLLDAVDTAASATSASASASAAAAVVAAAKYVKLITVLD